MAKIEFLDNNEILDTDTLFTQTEEARQLRESLAPVTQKVEADIQEQKRQANLAQLMQEIGEDRLKIIQEESPTFSAFFPRLAEARARTGQDAGLEQSLSMGADLLSAPGRAAVSLFPDEDIQGETFGERFREDLRRTEGTGFVEDILRSPELGATVLTAPVSAPLAAGKGLAAGGRTLAQATGQRAGLGKLSAIGAGEGLVAGSVTQAEQVGRGGEFEPGQFVGDVTLGAALPGVLKGVAKTFTKGINPAVQQAAEFISEVDKEALKKFGLGFGAGAKQLKEFAGQANEVGQNLLQKIDQFKIPGADRLKGIVREMPTISTKDAVKQLESLKSKVLKGKDDFGLAAEIGNVGEQANFDKKIDDLIESFSSSPSEILGPTGQAARSGRGAINLDAESFLTLRRRLDDVIDWNKPYAKNLNEALKSVRSNMAESLRESAKKSGNNDYVKIMSDITDALSARDDLYRFIGSRPEVRTNRVESFINTISSGPKAEKRKALRKIGEVLGEDFMEQSNLVNLAKQFGENGVPKIFSNIRTGKAGTFTLGTSISAGSVDPLLALPAAVATSAITGQRAQAGAVGLTDLLTRGVERGAQALQTGQLPERFALPGILKGLETGAGQKILGTSIRETGAPREAGQSLLDLILQQGQE